MKIKKSTVDKNSIHYGPGQIIFEENDEGNEMYLIISGEVEIYKKVRNAQKVLMNLGKGSIFGEMALVDKTVRSASARAKTDLYLMVIKESQWEIILSQNSDFAVNLIKILSRRLREANSIISELLTQDKRKQVLGAFMEFSRENGQKTYKGYLADVLAFSQWSAGHIGIEESEVRLIIDELIEEEFLFTSPNHENFVLYDPKRKPRG